MRQQYNPDLLLEAVNLVSEGRLSYRKAAEMYEVPRSTIADGVNQKYKTNSIGRPTTLSNTVEELIVHALIKLGDWGFGFTDNDLLGVIKTYLDKTEQNVFVNNIPGKTFLKNFRERWKHRLSDRLAQNLPSNRAQSLTPAKIDDFFQMCLKYYDFLDIHAKPQNIYNCDESGFSGNQGSKRVLCKKGIKYD